MENNVELISGFRCEVDETSILLGYYAAQSGNSLPTFRDRCPERSGMNYHYTLLNIPEERRSQCWMYVKKESTKGWTGFIWLRIRFICGICDDINGHSNSLKDLNIPW